MRYKLGIGVSTTCTDLVLLHETTGQLAFGRISVDPKDAFAGIRTGIGKLLTAQSLNPADINTVVLGMTFVADSIQNRSGSRTALITGRGQESLPETGRDAQEDQHDPNSPAPSPLVARSLRRGVTEEINGSGEVVVPLADDDVARAVDGLVDWGVKTIAVALPNAALNPVHEALIGAYIRRHYPHVAVSLSTDVTSSSRPYDRLTATILNAYVQPSAIRYLTDLQQQLLDTGLTAPLHLITSDGALITVDAARRAPIDLLASGFVGSVLATAQLGERMSRSNLLSFDMGDRSAQLSLITGGKLQRVDAVEVGRVHRFKPGTGLRVAASGIDLVEIGAGAASLVCVDETGKLRVGPEGAPPETGPACYGRGGTRPTVMDADLLLGYLGEQFLGGQTLNRGAARRALLEHVALPLDISVEEAARSVHQLANEMMAHAALAYLSAKGLNPRSYSLLALGGAGPVHGFGVARLLGTTDVIVPAGTGVASTMGGLLAPLISRHSHTYISTLAGLDFDQLNALLASLEQTGRDQLERAGADPAACVVTRTVDLRYQGQQAMVTTRLPPGPLLPELGPELQQEFARQATGTAPTTEPAIAETVTWRVICTQVLATTPEMPAVVGSVVGRGDFSGLKGYRQVIFMDDDFPVSCPVYDGSRIQPGDCLSGPVIIEEYETTVVVGRKAYVRMDTHRNLTITLR